MFGLASRTTMVRRIRGHCLPHENVLKSPYPRAFPKVRRSDERVNLVYVAKKGTAYGHVRPLASDRSISEPRVLQGSNPCALDVRQTTSDRMRRSHPPNHIAVPRGSLSQTLLNWLRGIQ